MLSIATFLSGCASMTEPTLAQVDATLVPSSKTETLSLPSGKAFFPDARLQALLTTALSNNRDLRIALAHVEEARAQYGIARADRLPSIEAGIGGTRSSTPADLSPTGRRYDVTNGNVMLTMPSYELDLWGRVANLNQVALASFLASEANAQAVRLTLMGDIASAYYQWLETKERLTLYQVTYNNRLEMRDLIAKRIAVGLAPETDRLQAEALNDGLLRDSTEIQRQHRIASNSLSLLVGVPVSSLTLPDALSLQQQADSHSINADLPSTLLLQRPDVQAAELRLKASDANVEAARAAFMPRISLTGGYGTASASLNGLFANNSESWNFMPQITLPLFNAGRTQANLDLAAARQVGAVADYEKTLQTAFREVADALINRANYVQQITHQRNLLSHQQQRLSLSEKRYLQGLVSYLEVLDAQRECQTAEQTLVQLIRAQKTSDVQLFKALGGSVS
jgi:multidrug efflux system outer membrane protein